MGDDQLYQAVGRIEGKLDALVDVVAAHIKLYEERHQGVLKSLNCVKADINQAKGAKGAIIALAGFIAGGISILANWLAK